MFLELVSERHCYVVNKCYEIYKYFKDVYKIENDEVIWRVIRESLEEYSRYDFILAYKVITTNENQYVIDIYRDISPYLIEILKFKRYSGTFYNLIQFPEFLFYKTFHNVKIPSNYEIILYNYNRYSKEFWLEFDTDVIIYGDRYIKVEPKTQYEVLYARKLTCDTLDDTKFNNVLKLCEYNLMIHSIRQLLFSRTSGNTISGNIRQVNISGMSVSFDNTPPERLLRELEEEKNRFLQQISDIDEYMLPERF